MRKTRLVDMPTDDILKLLKKEENAGKFRVLSKTVRTRVRQKYKDELNIPLIPQQKTKIYLISTDEKLANNYERAVTGDHGAYIEIAEKDIKKNILHIKKGHEWRLKNKLCKYVWYESSDGDKVYYQRNTVKYADYKPGYYYIDPGLTCYV